MSLEKEVKLLEDEMLRIREEGAAVTADAKSSNADLTLQIETLKSQEKLLKAKVREYSLVGCVNVSITTRIIKYFEFKVRLLLLCP